MKQVEPRVMELLGMQDLPFQVGVASEAHLADTALPLDRSGLARPGPDMLQPTCGDPMAARIRKLQGRIDALVDENTRLRAQLASPAWAAWKIE